MTLILISGTLSYITNAQREMFKPSVPFRWSYLNKIYSSLHPGKKTNKQTNVSSTQLFLISGTPSSYPNFLLVIHGKCFSSQTLLSVFSLDSLCGEEVHDEFSSFPGSLQRNGVTAVVQQLHLAVWQCRLQHCRPGHVQHLRAETSQLAAFSFSRWRAPPNPSPTSLRTESKLCIFQLNIHFFNTGNLFEMDYFSTQLHNKIDLVTPFVFTPALCRSVCTAWWSHDQCYSFE